MSIFLLRDVRQMLLKLVELRSSDWGRVRAASASSNATPDNDPNYFMVSVNYTMHPICLFFKFCIVYSLCISVCHGFVFLFSEWTYILHRRWYSFYSSRPRWGYVNIHDRSGEGCQLCSVNHRHQGHARSFVGGNMFHLMLFSPLVQNMLVRK